MRTKRITPFIDSALTFITSAILTATLSAYFLQDSLSLIAAAITVGVCVTALVKISRNEKLSKINPDTDRLIQALIYGGTEFANETFINAFKKRYSVDKSDGFLMLAKTAVFIDFKPRKLNHTELAYMYAKAYNAGAYKLTILSACGLDKEAEAISKRLPHIKIKIPTADKIYAILSTLDAMPLYKNVLTPPPKKNVKEFLSAALEPERANGYLFISVALALSSLIMPYSFYYMFFAVLCLILGVLSKADIKDKLLNRKSRKNVK